MSQSNRVSHTTSNFRDATASRRSTLLARAAMAVLMAGTVTQAASVTWDANGGTAGQTDGAGAWKGANQWWDGAANVSWASSDDAVFGNGGTGGAVTLASATAAQSITFNAFTGTYTLGTVGNALTIGSGGVQAGATAGAVNFVSPIALGAAQAWVNNSASAITITNSANAGAIAYGSSLLTLNGGAFMFALSSSGTSIGAGGVKITGGSTVTNGSTNSPFGAGTLELNNGSLINSTTSVNRTISNAVSITGDFTIGAGGATASNTFTGLTSTTGDRTLTANTSAAIFNNVGAVTLGGNLQVNGSGAVRFAGTGGVTGTSNVTINTTGTVGSTLGAGSVGITGTLTNSGSGISTTTVSGALGATVTGVTQSGSGTLLLSGTNTNYAGPVNLSAGTLALSSATALGGNGSATGTGGTLTITGGNLDATAATTLTTVNATNWNGNFGFLGTSTLSLGTGAVTMNADRTVTVNASTLSVRGAIGDGGSGFGLTKLGAGTLALSGANTYSGLTSVHAGTLALAAAAPNGSAGSLGNATSAVVLGNPSSSNSATLLISASSGAVVARDVTAQSGNTGTLTLASNNGSGSGNYSGTIQLGSTASTGKGITFGTTGNGTLQLSGVVRDPVGLSGAAAPVTILSSGSGPVVMSGNSTYAGGTILQSGSLRVQNVNGLGTGALTINGGAFGGAGFGGSPVTIANDQIWNANFNSGTAAGPGLTTTGAVSVTGNRTLTMTNVTLTLQGNIADSVPGANNVLTLRNSGGGSDGGATWNLSGNNSFGGGVVIVGAVQKTTVGAGSATALGSGQTRLSTNTNSVLSLSSNLTLDSLGSSISVPTTTGGTLYTVAPTATVSAPALGGTTATIATSLNAGAVVFTVTDYGSGYTSAPTITLSGGTTTGTAATIASAAFGASSVNLNNRTLTLAGTNATPAVFAGVLSGGSGSVVKQGVGTQTLTGVNTYTGGTTITAGKLAVALAGSVNGTSGISINGSSAIFQYDSSAALTKPVSFGASGGKFLYNENATGYSGGALTVGSGATLGGSGKINSNINVTNGGTLAPGNSPGMLTTDGSVTLASGATFAVELDGATAGEGAGFHDQLVLGGASGDINLNGATLSTLFSGFTPSGSDVLYIINNVDSGRTVSGVFAGLAASGAFVVSYGAQDWYISYDADLQGSSLHGGNDVALYTVVPEPTALAVVGLLTAGVLRRRRNAAA